MRRIVRAVCLVSMFISVPSFSQDIDCSVIKDNPPSRKRCEDGQAEARKWQREKERQQLKEQRIKEALEDAKRLGKECLRSKLKCAKEAVRPKPAG